MQETKLDNIVTKVEGIVDRTGLVIGAVIVALFKLAMKIVFGGFALLLAYGIVVIIFKYAFEVHLPNPFQNIPSRN